LIISGHPKFVIVTIIQAQLAEIVFPFFCPNALESHITNEDYIFNSALFWGFYAL